MKTVTVKANQSLRDIAVQYYGNMEAMGKLMTDNPGLKNDPAALAALGIDSIGDEGFYLDAPVLPGSRIAIDTDSNLLKSTVVREMGDEVTTFDL